jgi:signal peptidase I
MARSAAIARSTPTPKKAPEKAEQAPKEGHRDTVEAIVVALILALVVRGFEAQAFVIPTGSMAPTLMGRHKELQCPQCGFTYTVNASEEVESVSAPRRVRSGICMNCRYQARDLSDTPSFKGDRILVMMFPYDLPFLPGASSPERWDVVVFRYPEEPEVSYIKRLVGLPGETIRLKHGDIYVKPGDGQGFRLQRKPLRHQAAMQMSVYDDRYRPRALAGQEAWRRWRSSSPGAWGIADPKVSEYRCTAPADGWSELRYHHLVPDPEQWEEILADRPLNRAPRPTLITDFYSYNTNLTSDDPPVGDEPRMDSENAWMQPHWVGDLTVAASVKVESAAGQLRLELIKGGIPHRCVVDLATGAASFQRGEQTLLEQATPLKGPGRYQVEFANVDDRLTLWVDGKPVAGEGVEFDSVEATPVPTAADLSPVGIAVRDGTVAVSDLVLKRDIYYTLTPGRIDYGSSVWPDRPPRNPVELFDFLSDPAQFANLGRLGTQEYQLGGDRYLMLGDNSPRSKDSRGWDSSDLQWDTSGRQSYEVQRSLLTGKAFYIYWPHGVPFGPKSVRLNPDIRLIFRPYVERMRWIR